MQATKKPQPYKKHPCIPNWNKDSVISQYRTYNLTVVETAFSPPNLTELMFYLYPTLNQNISIDIDQLSCKVILQMNCSA